MPCRDPVICAVERAFFVLVGSLSGWGYTARPIGALMHEEHAPCVSWSLLGALRILRHTPTCLCGALCFDYGGSVAPPVSSVVSIFSRPLLARFIASLGSRAPCAGPFSNWRLFPTKSSAPEIPNPSPASREHPTHCYQHVIIIGACEYGASVKRRAAPLVPLFLWQPLAP